MKSSEDIFRKIAKLNQPFEGFTKLESEVLKRPEFLLENIKQNQISESIDRKLLKGSVFQTKTDSLSWFGGLENIISKYQIHDRPYDELFQFKKSNVGLQQFNEDLTISMDNSAWANFSKEFKESYQLNEIAFKNNLSLSYKFAQDYFETNNRLLPDWTRRLKNLDESILKNNFGVFEAATGSTLMNLAVNFGDNSGDGGLQKTSENNLQIENAELRQQLDQIYKTYATRIVKRFERKKRIRQKELTELSKKIALFIHRALLKNSSITPQQVYSVVQILCWVFLLIIATEYDHKTEDTPSVQNDSAVRINTTLVYDAKIQEGLMNFTENQIAYTEPKSKLYLRNSTKTRVIACIEESVTVIILSAKRKWSFVELAVDDFDKRGKYLRTRILRGWIQNKKILNQK